MELGDDGILTKEAIGMIQTKWDDTLWELEVLLFQSAKAQRDAMIAAGYHKHEPVAELDLATTLHNWMAKQKFGTEGHEEALLHAIVCCDWVSQQRFIKCLADIIHKADWRKIPPEGEGLAKMLNLAQRILEFAFYGDYSNGNDAFGVDEGRVRAREALDSFDAELKEVKRNYLLAQEEK